jgi:hypothetical protein
MEIILKIHQVEVLDIKSTIPKDENFTRRLRQQKTSTYLNLSPLKLSNLKYIHRTSVKSGTEFKKICSKNLF